MRRARCWLVFGYRNSLEVEDQWPLSALRCGMISVKPMEIIARMSIGKFLWVIMFCYIFDYGGLKMVLWWLICLLTLFDIFFMHSDIVLSQVQVSSGSFCSFSRRKTWEILWYLWKLVVYFRISFTAVVFPISMHASFVDTFVQFIHGFDQSAFPF